MRLLLALDQPELHRYFERDSRVHTVDIVHNAKHLREVIRCTKADILVLSAYLDGMHQPKEMLEYIRATRPELRIVYLCCQANGDEEFVNWLRGCNYIDSHVGSSITSIELNRLIFSYDRTRPSFGNLLFRKAKTQWFKELDTAVISVYSNSSNGKSHFAWNLAAALNKYGYSTTLMNFDRGYSANIYFGIEDVYHDLMNYMISNGDYNGVLEGCFKRGNLSVITGRLGDIGSINSEDFTKLLYFARAKSDVVIIDTHTGLCDITLQAINNSTIDFLIYDNDLMHFHMNTVMLERLGSVFIDNKTYALINNCNTCSESYKYIYKQINKLAVKFKDILPLNSCGSLGYDLMATGKTPYEAGKSNSSFNMDMNNILLSLKVRNCQ